MNTVFACIPEFNGQYFINIEGTIKTISGRIKNITGYDDPDRYLQVSLRKGNKHTIYMVHILVAKTFIPNPFYGDVVNHLDSNIHNPHRDNLEWTTHQGNMLHAVENGRRKSKYKLSGKLHALSLNQSIVIEVPQFVFCWVNRNLMKAKNPKGFTHIKTDNGLLITRIL